MKALGSANAFFKLVPDPERLRNHSFLVSAYDSVVHKRFKRMFVKIKDQGGSITEDIANEAIRKRRNQLAQVRKEFADANQFPEWFVALVGNYDLTSDDEDLNNGGYEIKTKFFRSDVWDLVLRFFDDRRGEGKVLPASSSTSGTKKCHGRGENEQQVPVLPPSTHTRLNAKFTSDFNLHYPNFFMEQQQAELANYIQEYKSGDLVVAYNISMGGEWIDLAEEEESNDEGDNVENLHPAPRRRRRRMMAEWAQEQDRMNRFHRGVNGLRCEQDEEDIDFDYEVDADEEMDDESEGSNSD
ncbi:hypothetical protein BT69DRAFT_1291920 [Atractiella rhizophila]|nr:hypothetical protein BT69DRAFT_1291920 [Atractiella rhizophila]